MQKPILFLLVSTYHTIILTNIKGGHSMTVIQLQCPPSNKKNKTKTKIHKSMQHNSRLLTWFKMCLQMLAGKWKFSVWFSLRVTPTLADSKPLVVVAISVFMWVMVWSLLCKDVWCMQPRVKSRDVQNHWKEAMV